MTVALNPEEELALLGRFPDAGVPAALLPVRLQTRFVTTGAQPELWVRVYPDELHVDTHEPALTDDEITWGRAFWLQTWRGGAGTDATASDRHAKAWELLVQRFGAERAAWVATAMTPTNPAARPQAPTPDDRELATSPTFPTPDRRAGSWTRAPIARLLPERWVVVGHRSGQRVVLASGQPVTANLHAGPD